MKKICVLICLLVLLSALSASPTFAGDLSEPFLLYRWGDDSKTVSENYRKITAIITSIANEDLISNMRIFINSNSTGDLEKIKNESAVNKRDFTLTGDIKPFYIENVTILNKSIEYRDDGSKGFSAIDTCFQFSKDALGSIDVFFIFEPDEESDDVFQGDSIAQKTALRGLFSALSEKYGSPSKQDEWLVGETRIFLDREPIGGNSIVLTYIKKGFENLRYTP